MCLILFALHQTPEYPLILIANRDEFYARPTEKAHFWEENPDLLAGKDLQAGGTWLGLRKKSLRFAALTNYRNPLLNQEGGASRGQIVRNFLESDEKPEFFLQRLQSHLTHYNAFNLICGNPEKLFYFSSTQGSCQPIPSGIHGLSNHLLDTAWPKVERGCSLLEKTLQEGVSEEKLLAVLKDRQQPADHELPETGIGLEWERVLAPIFICSPEYGTRCSTLLRYNAKGDFFFTEVSWDEKGKETKKIQLEWRTESHRT